MSNTNPPDHVMGQAARLYLQLHERGRECKPGIVSVQRPVEYVDVLYAEERGRFAGFWEALQVVGVARVNGYGCDNPCDILRRWLMDKGMMTNQQTLADWADNQKQGGNT